MVKPEHFDAGRGSPGGGRGQRGWVTMATGGQQGLPARILLGPPVLGDTGVLFLWAHGGHLSSEGSVPCFRGGRSA